MDSGNVKPGTELRRKTEKQKKIVIEDFSNIKRKTKFRSKLFHKNLVSPNKRARMIVLLRKKSTWNIVIPTTPFIKYSRNFFSDH